MSLRHNHKVVLQIHTICRHARSNTHTLALSEEEGSSISQLHPSKIDAKTAIGTSSKSTEGTLGRSTLFFSLEPTSGIEARMYISDVDTKHGIILRTHERLAKGFRLCAWCMLVC